MSNDNTGQPPYAGGPPPADDQVTSVSFNRSKIGAYDGGIVVAAIVFFIAMLLPWAHASTVLGFGEVHVSGFHYGILWFAFLLLILSAVWVLLPAFGVSLLATLPRPLITVVGVGLGALLAIIGFFVVMSDVPDVTGIEAGLSFGAYLGLIAALAAAVCAGLLFRAQQSGATQPALPTQLGGPSHPQSPPTQTAPTSTPTWSPPPSQAPAQQPPVQPPAYQPPAQQQPPVQTPVYQPPPSQQPPVQSPTYQPPAQQPPPADPSGQYPPQSPQQ